MRKSTAFTLIALTAGIVIAASAVAAQEGPAIDDHTRVHV